MSGEGESGKSVLHASDDNTTIATNTAIILEAATGVKRVWDVKSPLKVTRVQVLVTVAFDYDTQTVEGIVSFFKRVTYGSDTNRVLIGRVRLIHGTGIGVRLYNDVDPVVCLPGQQIVADVTTAGVGGTELGDYQMEVEYVPVPEMPDNCVSPAGVSMLVNAAP